MIPQSKDPKYVQTNLPLKFASCLKLLLQNKIKPLVSNFQYDSSSYRSQLDSQNNSNISDRSITPLCNTSPISFLSPIEPTNDQIEQMDTTHKVPKSSDTDNNEFSFQNHKPPEQSASTPPPLKKKYDIMKDPIFLTSPVYPPLISPKDSISTQKDEYLIPILSHENFTFKSQLTSISSIYMHPTDYTFKLYDKNQAIFTSIASKIMTPYRYWRENNV